MCGIAGAIGRAGREPRRAVEQMLAAMAHRGPDQDGLLESPESDAVLGHLRLSIIDLSEAGRQPMVDAGSGVVLIFNGECYNYQELKQELAAAGHGFVSSSDSEVILKAYLEWGPDCVRHLRGMFALVLWDPRIGEALVVRDRLGIKPLYFAARPDGFLFASEVRGLLATGEFERRLDPQGVARYLWHGFVPGPGTIVKGISRLDPGTYLRVNAAGAVIEEVRYWSLPPGRPATDLAPGEAFEKAQHALEEAAAMHLVSDVPLGVFLSGGVDSSVVTALAQRAANGRVATFNIRFEEAQYDESSYARTVADALGTDHRELTLTEGDFHAHLEDALASLDQPTFDAINTYFVSRAVREAGMTVALAGTGGDELFGGYQSFKELGRARCAGSVLRVLPRRMRQALARTGTRLALGPGGEVQPQVRWGKLVDLVESGGDWLAAYQVSYSLFTRDFQSSMNLDAGPHPAWGVDAAMADHLRAGLQDDAGDLQRTSRLELASFLGERLLPDTDSASMASSLEVRVPLLDHVLVEALQQLPADERYAPLGSKNFLRSAVAGDLDPSLFDRPKAGFELPLEPWCRNALADELECAFHDIGFLRTIGLEAESVGRLWRSFKAGAPGLYWSRIWSLFVLQRWCRAHGVTA